MKTSKNRSEQFESKPVLSKVEGVHKAQRTRQHDAQRLVAVQTNLQVMLEPHTQWVGEERAPRNAASGRVAASPPGTQRPTPCGCIELRSRFVGVFK
jgi:hypothetical protein